MLPSLQWRTSAPSVLGRIGRFATPRPDFRNIFAIVALSHVIKGLDQLPRSRVPHLRRVPTARGRESRSRFHKVVPIRSNARQPRRPVRLYRSLKFAPHMRPACRFDDAALLIYPVEARITVGLSLPRKLSDARPDARLCDPRSANRPRCRSRPQAGHRARKSTDALFFVCRFRLQHGTVTRPPGSLPVLRT